MMACIAGTSPLAAESACAAHASEANSTLAVHPARSWGLALDLGAAEVTDLRLLPGHTPDGAVDLSDTRVGQFRDDPATWPAELHLQGFIYDSFGSGEAGVRRRLEWLGRHEGGYVPQVYDQFASTCRHAAMKRPPARSPSRNSAAGAAHIAR